MTLTEAKRLIELAGKATSGEWIVVDNSRDQKLIIAEGGATLFGTGPLCNPKNADYVAACNPDAITNLCESYLEALDVIRLGVDFVEQCLDQGKTWPAEIDSFNDRARDFLLGIGDE